jgi:hypothetical protein
MSKRSTTVRQFDAAALRIRGFLRPSKVGSKSSVIEQLLAEARQVLLIEAPADPLSEPDDAGCWPSTTPMNGSPGGGSGGVVGSRVETAGVARAMSGVAADPISSIARSVEGHVLAIESHLVELQSDMGRFHRLRSPADLDNGRWCYVAKHVHGLPFDAVWEPHKQTTFEGVLDRPWPEPQWVSRWCYDFTRSHKRLPTEDEMKEYLTKGRVLVRAGGTSRG